MQFRSLLAIALFSLGALSKPAPDHVPVFNKDCSNVCYNSRSNCKFTRCTRLDVLVKHTHVLTTSQTKTTPLTTPWKTFAPFASSLRVRTAIRSTICGTMVGRLTANLDHGWMADIGLWHLALRMTALIQVTWVALLLQWFAFYNLGDQKMCTSTIWIYQ
jgi:hypothetical protein